MDKKGLKKLERIKRKKLIKSLFKNNKNCKKSKSKIDYEDNSKFVYDYKLCLLFYILDGIMVTNYIFIKLDFYIQIKDYSDLKTKEILISIVYDFLTYNNDENNNGIKKFILRKLESEIKFDCFYEPYYINFFDVRITVI